MKEFALHGGGDGERITDDTLLTAIIVGPEGARVDPGAIHGRSAAETGIQFVNTPEPLSRGVRYAVVWVSVELSAEGKPVRYKGLTACTMTVDRSQGTGHKPFAEHVNRMYAAVKGEMITAVLTSAERAQVQALLAAQDPALWQASPDAFRQAVG